MEPAKSPIQVRERLANNHINTLYREPCSVCQRTDTSRYPEIRIDGKLVCIPCREAQTNIPGPQSQSQEPSPTYTSHTPTVHPPPSPDDNDHDDEPPRKSSCLAKAFLILLVVIATLALFGFIVFLTDRYTATTTDSASQSAPTEQAAPNNNEAVYRTEVVDILATLYIAVEKVQQLSSDTANSPNLLVDETWQRDVAVQLAIIRHQNQRTALINPPPNLIAFNTLLIQGMRQCNEFVTNMANSIDRIDAGLLAQAIVNLNECGDTLTRAVEHTEW